MGEQQNKELRHTELRRAAMDLLARREHSRQELERKLARRGDNAEPIAAVIEALRSEGLQSDRRFADSFIHSRAQRLYGPFRIRQELRQRGLDPALVETALREAEVDWNAQLSQLWRRRTGGKPCADRRERMRHLRFCQQRGFDVSRLGSDEADPA